jgi:hypothetical protein
MLLGCWIESAGAEVKDEKEQENKKDKRRGGFDVCDVKKEGRC